MALSDNRFQRTVVLCALYFAQGLPRTFLTVVIISYLTDRGLTAANAGILTAMFLLPGTFKFVWAPIIDSISFNVLGRRRPWIIFAQSMMAISLLCLMFIDPINNLTILGYIFFFHNCFTSLQDVAADALTLDIVPKQELGLTNGLMWSAKILGMGTGSAGMAFIMINWGFSTTILIQFIILICIMSLPIFILERPGDKYFIWIKYSLEKKKSVLSLVSPIEVLRNLFQAFWIKTTFALFLFGFLISISEGIIGVITKPLYTKDLGWDYAQYSYITGLSTILQVLAAIVSGYIADKLGRRTIMTLGFGAFGLMAIGFGAFSLLWTQSWFSVLFLLLIIPVDIFGSMAFLSMAMRVSWTKSAATVFTTLMTICIVGQTIGSGSIGLLMDRWGFGYQAIFWLAGAFMIVPLILLFAVRPEEVDRIKNLAAIDQNDDVPARSLT